MVDILDFVSLVDDWEKEREHLIFLCNCQVILKSESAVTVCNEWQKTWHAPLLFEFSL